MNQPASLALLKTHSLPSLVQEELERMILDGRLVPGEPLREAALAASLGVSRGPVREAFRALEEKGLVLVEKNHGVQVRTLSLEEADEIYEVRICLEELIGQKAAASADVAGRRELKAVQLPCQGPNWRRFGPCALRTQTIAAEYCAFVQYSCQPLPSPSSTTHATPNARCSTKR